jgi:hypothetical protein
METENKWAEILFGAAGTFHLAVFFSFMVSNRLVRTSLVVSWQHRAVQGEGQGIGLE